MSRREKLDRREHVDPALPGTCFDLPLFAPLEDPSPTGTGVLSRSSGTSLDSASVVARKGPSVEKAKRGFCFTVMRFGDEDLDEIYHTIIRPVVEKCLLMCRRADELPGTTEAVNRIHDRIKFSELVIAEVSDSNPNVMYEIGYAKACGVPVLLLSQSTANLPFDIAHLNVIRYEPTLKGCRKLAEELARHVMGTLEAAESS